MRKLKPLQLTVLALLVLVISIWWSLVNTTEFKVRKLIAEASYPKGSLHRPSRSKRLYFVASLSAPCARTRTEIRDDLVAMGESAVPHLINQMLTGEAHNIHIESLGMIGEPAVGPVIKAFRELDRSDAQRYNWLTGTLKTMGPIALKAAPILVNDLDHPDARIRIRAANTLLMVDKQIAIDKAMSLVLKERANPDPHIFLVANAFLGEVGPATDEAAEALEVALKGKHASFYRHYQSQW